jgi:hypothetical protein
MSLPPEWLDGPAGLYLDSTIHHLYVASRLVHEVLVFDVSDNAFNGVCDNSDLPICSLNPVQAITRAPDAAIPYLLDAPNWPFLDTASNPTKLYVTNRDNSAILVYNEAETINGGVMPSRSIFGSSSGLNIPVGLFIDPTR